MISLAALTLLWQLSAPPPDSGPGFPCTRTEGVVGCVPAMKPARTYDGVWLDAFEGQEFFPHAVRPADVDLHHAAPWIDIDRVRVLRDFIDRRTPGARLPDPYIAHFYHVRFVGAEAVQMNCKGVLRCYGHMGGSPGLFTVERVLAIEDLGPLRPDT